MKRKHALASLVASLALPLTSMSASAAIVTSFSDDFEPPGETSGFNKTDFTKWNVDAGAVDLVPVPNGFGGDCNGSLQCVDLDGTMNADGTLTTKDSFAPGLYRVSFELSGSQRTSDPSVTNGVTVLFGDLGAAGIITGVGALAGWTTYMFDVTVSPGDGPLAFLSFMSQSGGDNIGLLLDNISVTLVPIPAAFWLFGSGLLGMFGLSRRRKAAQT